MEFGLKSGFKLTELLLTVSDEDGHERPTRTKTKTDTYRWFQEMKGELVIVSEQCHNFRILS